MFAFETQLRVRYADTDQMGYVYYGNYGRFYEIARVEALRSLGVSYRELEASGMMMPVYEMHVRYHQPARYDDLLTIRASILQLPAVRIRFDYQVRNEAGILLNVGDTTLVFVRVASNRPCVAPPELLRSLTPFFAPHADVPQ